MAASMAASAASTTVVSTAVVSTGVAALVETVFTALQMTGADSAPAQSPEIAAWRSA
jgi:hypothetical protein